MAIYGQALTNVRKVCQLLPMLGRGLRAQDVSHEDVKSLSYYLDRVLLIPLAGIVSFGFVKTHAPGTNLVIL